MKVSMLSIRAWARPMMNWFTHAMACDLRKRKGQGGILLCFFCAEEGGKEKKKEESTFHQPDFGAAVLEKLQELGDHDVEWPVQGVAVQQLGGILADLLQGSERALDGREEKCIECKLKIFLVVATKRIFVMLQCQSDLTGVVVLRVEKVAELRQQLRPRLQLPFGGDGRDQDAFKKRNIDIFRSKADKTQKNTSQDRISASPAHFTTQNIWKTLQQFTQSHQPGKISASYVLA